MLNEMPIGEATIFEADLDGITKIQKQFLEAKEFTYLRKGEFDNAWDVMIILAVIYGIMDGTKQLIADSTKAKKYLHQAVNKWREQVPQKTLDHVRIVSRRTTDNKYQLDMFKRMGAGVCIIPKSKAGRIRFFLNENEFCLFIRREKDVFFGVRGDNIKMVEWLKQLFEQEYTENTK